MEIRIDLLSNKQLGIKSSNQITPGIPGSRLPNYLTNYVIPRAIEAQGLGK